MVLKIAAWLLLPCFLFFNSLIPPLAASALEIPQITEEPQQLILEDDELPAPLVISEAQTGGMNDSGEEDGRQEFIELYNQTTEELDVSGWQIQYFAASRENVTDPLGDPTRLIYELNGVIGPNGFVLLSYVDYLEEADAYFGEGSTASSGLLAKTGGHIRVLNNAGNIIDILGWGSAKQPEGNAVAQIPPGSSAARIEAGSSAEETSEEPGTVTPQNDPDPNIEAPVLLVDTGDNSQDFEILDKPTPLGGDLELPELPTEDDPITTPPEEDTNQSEEADSDQGDIDVLTLEITELLPNPGENGLDSEDEFIEIRNPNEFTIDIGGFKLYTASASKTYSYTLPETILEPNEYRAFYSKNTNLVLVNSTGYAWIEAPDGGLLSETHWYEDVGEDEAWALLGGEWKITNRPTPNAANQPSLVEEVLSDNSQDNTFADCGEGRFRNPETNRCKKIETGSGLVPCNEGQERNPDTNRCRSVLTAASSMLKPCNPGQERNPETNRCRKIVTAASTLKPCQEGYERNPETNRCRKSTSSTNPASTLVATNAETPESREHNYTLLIIVAIMALGYGIYEYRQDIGNIISKVRGKSAAK